MTNTNKGLQETLRKLKLKLNTLSKILKGLPKISLDDTNTFSGYLDIGSIRFQWGYRPAGTGDGDIIPLSKPYKNNYYTVLVQVTGPHDDIVSTSILDSASFYYYRRSGGSPVPGGVISYLTVGQI